MHSARNYELYVNGKRATPGRNDGRHENERITRVTN